MNDIVYFVKEASQNEELRYSLRSLCNFPHAKVWFYGGCPDGLKPDEHVFVPQIMDGNVPQSVGISKYYNVRKMLQDVCKNNNISKDFWLFNDDFFVMTPVENFQITITGSLFYRAQLIERSYGRATIYSQKLKTTARVLRDNGYDRLNYEMHIPMLINRRAAEDVMYQFSGQYAFRSVYGNIMKLGGVIGKDVKIFDLTTMPDESYKFLSTTDESFQNGEVGKYIRSKFTEKCKYEEGFNG